MLALAQIAGFGHMVKVGDPLAAGLMLKIASKVDEIIDEKLDYLAGKIRQEMADAWNKGQKG